MLLHLRPRLLSLFRDVRVVAVRIPSLGLVLNGQADLTARRPYPNKSYTVVCRRRGNKAIDGIFIETATAMDCFDLVTRWAIESHTVVTHQVRYVLLDDEFDAASDCMALWHAWRSDFGEWSNRLPPNPRKLAPVRLEPVMELEIESLGGRVDTDDTLDAVSGLIALRHQTFGMPTVERQRIVSRPAEDRLPAIADAFLAPARGAPAADAGD